MTKTYEKDALLICGSRGIKDDVTAALLAKYPAWDRVAVVLCGMAQGVDLAAHRVASDRGLTIEEYPVTRNEWVMFGPKAGPARNARMIARLTELRDTRDLQPVVVAVWDGQSRGTRDTISRAERAGFAVTILYPKDKEEPTP
jgi:hypothetical protein